MELRCKTDARVDRPPPVLRGIRVKPVVINEWRGTAGHERGRAAVDELHGRRPAHGEIATPVIRRAALDATPRPGPLLVDEYDATTLIPPGCTARLDAHGNIVISTGGTR